MSPELPVRYRSTGPSTPADPITSCFALQSRFRRKLKNGHGEYEVSVRSVGTPLVTGDLSTEAKVSAFLARLQPRARPGKSDPV